MQKSSYDIAIFFLVVTGLIVFMVAFIISIVYFSRRRQMLFQKNIEQLKLENEKTILNAQLEVQEQTFQHISREIHDNINLSLTLVKLHLHTFDWKNKEVSSNKLSSSIELLTDSIKQLSNISKSLNADIIAQHGLLEAIQEELKKIRRVGLFAIEYKLSGNPVYMDSQKELIIFRIIQEAFNNIIRHSEASNSQLSLYYNEAMLEVNVWDNGQGFDPEQRNRKNQAGLRNMESRVKSLNGDIRIESIPGTGTTVFFTIPYNNDEQ